MSVPLRTQPPTVEFGFCSVPFSSVLTPRLQANVIVDLNGRARLAGYGLVPINSDPAFTISGNSESLANSRWLAPEIMEPPRRRNVTAMRESKAADVFAFGMLAVEVFTGEVPFVGQGDGAVIFQILRGERPKMPENAQEVGLTVEMWNLIESCWKQNPKKRPTIGEVLVKLQELFSDTKDNSNDLECVQISSPLVPFPTIHVPSRDAQPVAEPAAGAVRQTISEAFRRIRMAIQPRRVSEAVHLGTITNSEWATLSVKRQNPEFSDQTLTPSQLFSLTLSQVSSSSSCDTSDPLLTQACECDRICEYEVVLRVVLTYCFGYVPCNAPFLLFVKCGLVSCTIPTYLCLRQYILSYGTDYIRV